MPSTERMDPTDRTMRGPAAALVAAALSLVVIAAPGLAAATGVNRGPELTSLANEIQAEASITFSDLYLVEAPSDLVLEALQNPLLMAALWESYAYTPTYEISPLDSQASADAGPDSRHLHAVDPTGIVGELHLVRQTANRSVWVGFGEIDHWAAPMLNSGRMVLEIFVAPGADTSRVGVQLYLDPKSRLASFVAKSFALKAQEMIERRVKANFGDAAKILEAIHRDPSGVAERLEGWPLTQFRQAFPFD